MYRILRHCKNFLSGAFKKRKRVSRIPIVMATVILMVYGVCVSFHVQRTRDWCKENHDRCCQIYRPSSTHLLTSKNTDDEETSIGRDLTSADIHSFTFSGEILAEVAFPVNSDVCGHSRVRLLVIVPTIPGNARERHAIRNTWGSRFQKDASLRLVFLTGMSNNFSKEELILERNVYNDIVQAAFIDSYKNLTMKTTVMLQWTKEFCRQADYVMKVDDDVFLHTDNLLLKLTALQNERRFIMGYTSIQTTPIRDLDNKWVLTLGEYPFNRFPVFVQGPAYVITRDLVDDLYSIARHKSQLPLEDVFLTGMSAHIVRASHVGRCGFNVGQRDVSAWLYTESVVTAHGYSPKEMTGLWTFVESWKMWTPLFHIYGHIVGM